MLACQQNVPEPSLVKPVVIVALMGLHAPATPVGVMLGVTVRVDVGPLVGVRVRVDVGPAVGVRVGVRLGPAVDVRVIVLVIVGGTVVKVGVGGMGVLVGPQEVQGVAVAPVGVAEAVGGITKVAVANGEPEAPL